MAITSHPNTVCGKISHKEWKKLKRKQRRRRQAQQQCKDLSEKSTDEEEEERKRKAVEEENERQNRLWLERDAVAHEEWEAQKEREEKERQRQEEVERKIKEEWEERQRQEAKELEEKEKLDKERRDKQLMSYECHMIGLRHENASRDEMDEGAQFILSATAAVIFAQTSNSECKKINRKERIDQLLGWRLTDSMYQLENLLKEATANENKEWHNPLAPVRHGESTGEVVREINRCPFFMKTGACRYGERCSRAHMRPESSTTLLIPGMFHNFELKKSSIDDFDTDMGLEYEDSELDHSFREFYLDVLPEFKSVGKVINFKVCCNHEPHLRGNVYVQYKRESDAQKAFMKFNARWYGGRQLSLEFVNIAKWKSAICGLFFRKRCPKGKACNFLHVFRNPGNEFWEADQDFGVTLRGGSSQHRFRQRDTPKHHRHEDRNYRDRSEPRESVTSRKKRSSRSKSRDLEKPGRRKKHRSKFLSRKHRHRSRSKSRSNSSCRSRTRSRSRSRLKKKRKKTKKRSRTHRASFRSRSHSRSQSSSVSRSRSSRSTSGSRKEMDIYKNKHLGLTNEEHSKPGSPSSDSHSRPVSPKQNGKSVCPKSDKKMAQSTSESLCSSAENGDAKSGNRDSQSRPPSPTSRKSSGREELLDSPIEET